MMEAVQNTKNVGIAMKNKDWALAVKLRGNTFQRNITLYNELGANKPIVSETQIKGLQIGLVNCGAPAGGMNAAIRAIVRHSINNNVSPVIIKDGFGGFLNTTSKQGKIFKMK